MKFLLLNETDPAQLHVVKLRELQARQDRTQRKMTQARDTEGEQLGKL